MTFERVHTVWEYYDGPRTGVADYRSRPHHYVCEWNSANDEFSEFFVLTPIDAETLALGLAQWDIFREWEAAFHRGEAPQSSHPGIPGQDARYSDLESKLARRIASSSASQLRAKGAFRAVANQMPRAKGVMRDFEVEWSDAT